MTVQVKTALALKEWSAVIDAVEEGRQIVALRKGGIREKAFLVEGRSFYLLPTFEHQAEDLVKPDDRHRIERAQREHRDETGLVVHARADVVDLWEVDDEARLRALTPYHIFTEDFARSRFNWRPKQPLTVMLLRAFLLSEPWRTGLPAGVGGCRSWLEVDAAAAPAVSRPALSDAEFEACAALLRTALS
jgi:hypothetical protein